MTTAGCATEPKPVVPNIAADLATGSAVSAVSTDTLREIMTAPSDQPRVVNFWATWCPPCIAELPAIEHFASTHPNVDVILVNTDMPQFRQTKVKSFLDARHIVASHNAAVDIPDQAAMLAAVVPDWPNAIPYTVVIDADGHTASTFRTAITSEQLERAVAGL